ncbi:MAG: rubredoxin [Nanoarchaeota archaeon]|nr:rubredoxin [Nanoarchaeota archaeon]
MARFVCKKCNYRFESYAKNVKKECPYCGEQEIKRELSAQELLELE